MTENSDFGTFGRYEETPVDRMPADMRAAYDYTLKLRGVVPGPHKIWLANPALSRAIVATGAYYQTGAERTHNAHAPDDRNWLVTQALELLAQTIRSVAARFEPHVSFACPGSALGRPMPLAPDARSREGSVHCD